MSGRRFVNQLADRESVNEVFLASEKKLRPNRAGQLYLQIELADRTGSITAMLWNAGDTVYNSFQPGDYLRVEGTAQLYQGEMQLIAKKVHRVPTDGIDSRDFTVQTPEQADRLVRQLSETLRSIEHPHLRALAECFLMDEVFMRDFTRVPAGIKNHHAFLGGLIDHVVTMMEVVKRISDLYPAVDRDLLLMGVFLHDAGKVQELSYERGFSYTDQGQLIGHAVLAVGMVDQKAQEAASLLGEPIDADLVLRVKHMIVSHHGMPEFGAIKVPMTLEGIALWQIDNLDSKLQSFEQQIKDDPNTDSPWTLYNAQAGRRLYKGQSEPLESE